MSDTPETDACWDDKECNILEHARRLERDRDEQCRLLGMSAERECDLRGKIERLELNQQVEALKEESSRWEKQWKAWENKWKCAVEMAAQAETDKYFLEEKLATERALADRLAGALEMVRDADDDCHKDGLQTIPPVARHKIDLSLTAWKEARSE